MIAAGNIMDEARMVTLTFDAAPAIERTICSDVEVTAERDAPTLVMPPHSFSPVWVVPKND